jgi:hypothetical protein
MASQPFVVIRLVPKSPVDWTTFSMHMHELAILFERIFMAGGPLEGTL